MSEECEPAREHTLDVRWLLNPRQIPRCNVRLRFAGSTLIDVRDLPAGLAPEPLAVVPPLVNAHAHLEFSDCDQPVSIGTAFPDWIRGVIAERRSANRPAGRGILQGMAESAAAGVAVVGDIVTSDLPESTITAITPTVIRFREFIGLDPQATDAAAETARRHLRTGSDSAGDVSTCRTAGLSPHAPYSVHPDLCAMLCDLAAEHQAPIAMHLAESPDEMELLSSGTGAFRTFLEDMGLWNPALFPSSAALSQTIALLSKARRGLIVHGNYLSGQQLQQIAETPQLSLVYCPRTHDAFGHPPHPWQQVRKAGGRVVLGTDGKVSNPDLSIWRELQFVARMTRNLTAAELLPMITTDAADALGRDPATCVLQTGSQSPGVVLDCGQSAARTAEDLLRDPTVQPAGTTTNFLPH